MNAESGFTLKVSQNKFLVGGAREVNAVVTVESTGLDDGPGQAPATEAVEVIILDTSASMEWPILKIVAARQAAMKAVDNLRDGVSFAVIAGNHLASMVYPRGEHTVEANWSTKIEAKAALGGLITSGGTAMGTWLQLADRLFAPHKDAIRHAILLTDGKNEHETPEQFGETLAKVAGRFVCDCRGIGTDWEPDELRRVSSALLGTVDIIPDPNDLEADFRAMTEHAMNKSVADVGLRIWRPQAARLKFVKQVLPTVEDLTHLGVESGRLIRDFPTGSWGNESRDYHICIEVPPGEVGQEMRAGWVRLVTSGDAPEVLASANILAEWTDEERFYTQIDAQVAHYTGQQELANVIQAGLHAKRAGDLDTATTRFGRAVALARQTGNEATAALLDKVVDVIDYESGTVRLKSMVEKVDEMSLDTRSTRTVRTRKE
ncbi:VWA domain-containing protein [Actinopolymorpha alba]|uniref:VWA domain-containing protein n=1 Tax=Actinopolymorpha alba TaxID=533267 RepID=UPI000379A664|nr:VWA domain-containing protein [Actinopolymorpha alba]